MHEKRFDPRKLEKLNQPERLKNLPPEYILERADVKDPKVLVDVGAGTGFFSVPFAQKFPNSKIFALDISETMVTWMTDNILPHYPNIVVNLMNNNQLDLPDSSVDFLFMINLHHELDEPLKMLAECKRVLKPGGKIAISDWKREQTDGGPPLEIRYEIATVEQELKQTQFQEINSYNELSTNFLVTAMR